MRRILIHSLVVWFLSLYSCHPPKEKEEPLAPNVLSEEQFIAVLTDAYLGEGAAGINIKNVLGEKYDSTYAFNPIADHHLTKAQFDSTIAYYAKHPKKLKRVYDNVLERLSQLQAKGKIEH